MAHYVDTSAILKLIRPEAESRALDEWVASEHPVPRQAMATWDDVARIGLDLPDVAVDQSYGTPSLKVRNKSFARMWSEREHVREAVDRADTEVLVVMCDLPARWSPELDNMRPQYRAGIGRARNPGSPTPDDVAPEQCGMNPGSAGNER